MAQEERSITNIHHNQISFYSIATEISIVILVFLTPLVFYPYLIRNFNPSKELVFELLVLICLALWALRFSDKERLQFTSTPLNQPIIGFIFICILSLLWSESPFLSLLELSLFLAGPILYFVIINNIENRKQVHRILAAILITGSLLGIYGILQYLGIDFSFWNKNIGRAQVFGLFGNVNYFAEYLIIPLTMVVPLFFSARNKTLKFFLFIGITAMSISLLLTFTRSSLLGFGIALIFMFFVLLFWEGKNVFKKYRRIILYCLLFIMMVTLIFWVPNPLNDRGTVISRIKERISITQLTQGHNALRRIATWKFTVLMIKDYPLLGSGLGTYQYNTLQYQAEFFEQRDNRSLYPYGIADKAHNEYLQLWAELGITGLAVFLWIIFSYFRYTMAYLRKERDKQQRAPGIMIGLMGAVVAVLIDAFFGFPLHLPATVSLFWLVIALTMVVIKREGLSLTTEKRIRSDDQKVYQQILKYILYAGIIIGIIFSGIMIVRPFISEVNQFYALQNIQRGNINGAVNHYQESLKWNPYAGMVYYNMGQILAEKEIYTIALEYFEKAARYIDHPDLPGNLAYLYLKKGMTEKAIPRLIQAISYQEREETMVPLYADLGKLYLQKRQFRSAEDAFQRSLNIDDGNIEALLGLGISFLNQHKIEEGLRELEKVLELAPDSREAGQAQDILQQVARENLKLPMNEEVDTAEAEKE